MGAYSSTLQKIEPKVGGGPIFHSGSSFARVSTSTHIRGLSSNEILPESTF